MARVISIHEYELRRDADGAAFEQALRDADMRGLFDLTGLVEHHFLRGVQRGTAGCLYRGLDIRKPRSMGEALG